MKNQSHVLLHFLGRCIAPAPAAFRPGAWERQRLAEELFRLEHMLPLTAPDSPARDLAETMLDSVRHRLGEGCFCRAGEAVALQRAYAAVGLLPRLPGYAGA